MRQRLVRGSRIREHGGDGGRLGVSRRSVGDSNAIWRADRLWLDSGPFEAWAKAQLEDPESPVHERGLELTKELGEIGPTYRS